MARLYDEAVFRRARKRMRGLPCAKCGNPSNTVGHIIAVSRGGTNDPGNLQPECARCNYSDGARMARRARKRKRKRWVNRAYFL